MARRIHVPILRIGDIPLDPAQAHHARDVLRLLSGTAVEVFDDAGATAVGVLHHLVAGESFVHIEKIDPPSIRRQLQWTIAAAVPKGDRADWMVEKLSELGTACFIPLATARSIVLPAGKNKWERWNRLATESAKQSRRSGVMRIEELTALESIVKRVERLPIDPARMEMAESPAQRPNAAWFLATEVPNAMPIAEAVVAAASCQSVLLFIGPEGGWTAEEITAFEAAGVIAIRLGTSILRMETAAIAASAIVSSFLCPYRARA